MGFASKTIRVIQVIQSDSLFSRVQHFKIHVKVRIQMQSNVKCMVIYLCKRGEIRIEIRSKKPRQKRRKIMYTENSYGDKQ